MRKVIFTLISILLGNITLFAWNPPDASLTFDEDSRTVTMSTTTTSPTRILIRDGSVQRTWIVNTSTFTIFVSSSSSNVSTSTSFGIPGTPTNATPVIWSPDGVNSPYAGDLWGVASTQSPPSISIFRSK